MFGQEHNLTENQGQINKCIVINIYCLIARHVPLKDTKTLYFHVIILLFAKRTRPDIQLCVPFLCRQVKSPTIQDHSKIGRIISYLKNTVQLPLIVETDSTEILT